MFFPAPRAVCPSPARPCRAAPSRGSASPTGTSCSTHRSSPTRCPRGTRSRSSGSGCFWGAEEIYWQLPGVWSTSVGYAGGKTPHPSYEEVCSGMTGHTEAVRVVFDPAVIGYETLVKRFFEVHDPTQGMRQGNDVGTQYRSAIYTTTPEQAETAERLTKVYGEELTARGLGAITTEVRPAPTYYYAEDHHQQYLAKNPYGYRCHANTGVPSPPTPDPTAGQGEASGAGDDAVPEVSVDPVVTSDVVSVELSVVVPVGASAVPLGAGAADDVGVGAGAGDVLSPPEDAVPAVGSDVGVGGGELDGDVVALGDPDGWGESLGSAASPAEAVDEVPVRSAS